MGLSDMARWQWALLGGGVGLLAAFSYTSTEIDSGSPGPTDAFLNRIGQVSAQPTSTGQPVLREVLVYPPVEGAYKKQVQVVKFNRLGIDPASGTPAVAQEMVLVELPIDRGGQTFSRVEDAMKQAGQAFATPWVRQPSVAYPMFAGVGIVFAGLFVPALLNVLSGGQIGLHRHERKKSKVNLYYQKNTKAPAKPVKAGPSLEEQSKLDELTATMEQGLADFAKGSASGGTPVATSSTAPSPIRLDAGASEPARPIAQAEPEKPKNFTGEWYPVAKNTSKD